ncbi:hypothetical protein IAT38_006788 [Cryptococcus sp. DSM 104549]
MSTTPTSSTLTTLAPLPHDIISPIYDFFVASIPLHSRQFQDLLILSRDVYDANVARLYEDVVLDEHNSSGFFYWAGEMNGDDGERDILALIPSRIPYSQSPSLSIRKYALIQNNKRLTMKHVNALTAISDAEYAASGAALCDLTGKEPNHGMTISCLFPETAVLVFHQSLMSGCMGSSADECLDAIIRNAGGKAFRWPHVCITFAGGDPPWELVDAFCGFIKRIRGIRSLTLHNSQGDDGSFEKDYLVVYVKRLLQIYEDHDIEDLPAPLALYNVHANTDHVLDVLDDGGFDGEQSWEGWKDKLVMVREGEAHGYVCPCGKTEK